MLRNEKVTAGKKRRRRRVVSVEITRKIWFDQIATFSSSVLCCNPATFKFSTNFWKLFCNEECSGH